MRRCSTLLALARRLEAQTSWSSYWNYLRRQLYVLDTWASAHNRRTNYILMVAHCCVSWTFVAAALLGARGTGKGAA